MIKRCIALVAVLLFVPMSGLSDMNGRLGAFNTVHRAENLYRSGKTDEAIRMLEQEVRRNGKLTIAYIDLIQWLTEKGDVNAAIDYGETGMKATDGNSYIIMALARAYQVAGKSDKTIQLIQGLKEEYFSHKDILEDISDAYLSTGLTELSLSILKELESRYPADPYVYNKLGTVYYKLGRKDLAIESFSKASALQPDDPVILNNIGIVYSDIGDYQDAIRFFSRAILKNPDCTYCYLNLGVAYRFSGDYKDALFCYRKAIMIDQTFKDAYYDLSVLEQGYMHNYPDAINYLEKYESLLPQDDKQKMQIDRRIMNLRLAESSAAGAAPPAPVVFTATTSSPVSGTTVAKPPAARIAGPKPSAPIVFTAT
ncbi:MAG: tetratricopeptide repeat protein, partial [Deltaproteobacteria bacterium]|nr:tetratricopeptide repeat protein [Deltaproteobacteria bacterium]